MSLRNRLVTYFSIVVVVVLVCFGISAYQISHQAQMALFEEMEQSQLQSWLYFTEQAQSADPYLRKLDADVLPSFSDSDPQLYILDQNRALIFQSTPQQGFPEEVGQLVPFFETEKNKGQVLWDGISYTWLQSKVPNTGLTLVLVNPDSAKKYSVFGELIQRLAAVGAILLWIAIWIALLLSTKISHRLAKKNEELEHLSNFDVLTGLCNRDYFNIQLADKVHNKTISNERIAVLMLDINRFKDINNALGHKVGDRLLQSIATNLRNNLHEKDIVARLGGDEFALILPIKDDSHTAKIAQKILDIVSTPIRVEGIKLEVEASMGIALFPDHCLDAATLLRCADIALHNAKTRNEIYSIYSEDDDPNSVEHIKLMVDLRHAITRSQLQLYYQPKVDFANGKIIGAEALIRWNHHEHGFVPPDEFIPMAEQTSYIRSLTLWTIHEAINHCARWHQKGKELSVAVNLSARTLHDYSLPKQIAATLKSQGLNAKYLELEITETAIMQDPARAITVVRELDRMGVKLSIDDFGTGYTSLSYLQDLPIREIKIDKSFVIPMMENPENTTMVQSIIDLGHSLGHTVVAEGIEDAASYKMLADWKCDVAQGYFISKPMAGDAFDAFLAKNEYFSIQPERVHG